MKTATRKTATKTIAETHYAAADTLDVFSDTGVNRRKYSQLLSRLIGPALTQLKHTPAFVMTRDDVHIWCLDAEVAVTFGIGEDNGLSKCLVTKPNSGLNMILMSCIPS